MDRRQTDAGRDHRQRKDFCFKGLLQYFGQAVLTGSGGGLWAWVRKVRCGRCWDEMYLPWVHVVYCSPMTTTDMTIIWSLFLEGSKTPSYSPQDHTLGSLHQWVGGGTWSQTSSLSLYWVISYEGRWEWGWRWRSHRCSDASGQGFWENCGGQISAPKDVHVYGHSMLWPCQHVTLHGERDFIDGIKDLKMVRKMILDYPGRLNVISTILIIGKRRCVNRRCGNRKKGQGGEATSQGMWAASRSRKR